jgi:hypothetical protein
MFPSLLFISTAPYLQLALQLLTRHVNNKELNYIKLLLLLLLLLLSLLSVLLLRISVMKTTQLKMGVEPT